MVRLSERKHATKEIKKAPIEIVRAYEIWARLVETHGLLILKEFPGYRDEALKGAWLGFRSSRLNKKWRVIYYHQVSADIEVVWVERVTAHDYRRK